MFHPEPLSLQPLYDLIDKDSPRMLPVREDILFAPYLNRAVFLLLLEYITLPAGDAAISHCPEDSDGYNGKQDECPVIEGQRTKSAYGCRVSNPCVISGVQKSERGSVENHTCPLYSLPVGNISFQILPQKRGILPSLHPASCSSHNSTPRISSISVKIR